LTDFEALTGINMYQSSISGIWRNLLFHEPAGTPEVTTQLVQNSIMLLGFCVIWGPYTNLPNAPTTRGHKSMHKRPNDAIYHVVFAISLHRWIRPNRLPPQKSANLYPKQT
jgi:hypothetical protein